MPSMARLESLIVVRWNAATAERGDTPAIGVVVPTREHGTTAVVGAAVLIGERAAAFFEGG